MTLKRPLLALLLVLGLEAVAVIGHAATLNLTGTSLSSLQGADRCTDTAVAVTHGTLVGGTASSVEVTVPAGCRGLDGLLRLVGPLDADDVAYTLPGTGPVLTVLVPGGYRPADVVAVAMTLDTWGVPTVWTTAPLEPSAAVSCRPVDPAVRATCTVETTALQEWGNGFRYFFTVTTTSATPFEWEARLDLSVVDQPQPGGTVLFPGYPVPAGSWWDAWYPDHFSASNLCAASTSQDLPVLRLRGPHGWNSTVSASSPVHSVSIQAQSSGGSAPESFACH